MQMRKHAKGQHNAPIAYWTNKRKFHLDNAWLLEAVMPEPNVIIVTKNTGRRLLALLFAQTTGVTSHMRAYELPKFLLMRVVGAI